MRTIKIPKLHNKATITEDSAEILLYGEVIDHRPVDFWTGEALPGRFICMDEFLEDLEAVKDHPGWRFAYWLGDKRKDQGFAGRNYSDM